MTRKLVILLLAGLVAALPPYAPADEATPALAKYDQPVDAAIDKALEYLAAQQQADGSFGQGGVKRSAAVTSLGVMAFLAKGHTPGAGRYGPAINKGIDFVISTEKGNRGLLLGAEAGGGVMYTHCISALMLSEVSGMVDKGRQAKIDAVLPAALKVILAAQQVHKPANQQGGWRYSPTSSDSDISCSSWALMALRSARNSGCSVP
jgi:hypothetical protein